jgi:hypothetical protein
MNGNCPFFFMLATHSFFFIRDKTNAYTHVNMFHTDIRLLTTRQHVIIYFFFYNFQLIMLVLDGHGETLIFRSLALPQEYINWIWLHQIPIKNIRLTYCRWFLKREIFNIIIIITISVRVYTFFYLSVGVPRVANWLAGV